VTFKSPLPARVLFVLRLCLALFAVEACALTPDQLLLIVNKNSPAGVELAAFYAKARNVPDGRILALDFPPDREDVSFDDYETKVVPRGPKLSPRAQPAEPGAVSRHVLRHAASASTGRRRRSPSAMSWRTCASGSTRCGSNFRRSYAGLEKLGAEMTPSFRPESGDALEQVGKRADAALRPWQRDCVGCRRAAGAGCSRGLAKLVLDSRVPRRSRRCSPRAAAGI
jgi:hypothetical protein